MPISEPTMEEAWLYWARVTPVSANALAALDDEERRHLARLATPRARAAQASSYLMRRQVIGAHLGILAAEVEMTRRCPACGASDHGPVSAPQLAAPGPTYLSISHTESVVGVALATTAIGLDVELARPENEWQEIECHVAHPDDDVASQLHRWTAKEAVLKLLQVGLARPMTSVRVAAEHWTLASRDDDNGIVYWYPLPDEALAALSTRVPLAVEVVRWTGG